MKTEAISKALKGKVLIYHNSHGTLVKERIVGVTDDIRHSVAIDVFDGEHRFRYYMNRRVAEELTRKGESCGWIVEEMPL